MKYLKLSGGKLLLLIYDLFRGKSFKMGLYHVIHSREKHLHIEQFIIVLQIT